MSFQSFTKTAGAMKCHAEGHFEDKLRGSSVARTHDIMVTIPSIGFTTESFRTPPSFKGGLSDLGTKILQKY